MEKAALERIDSLAPLALGGVRVIVLLVGGYVLTLIINRLIRAIRDYSVYVMTRHHGLAQGEVEKRAATVGTAVRRVLLTLLWGALVMMSLQELGFKIDALLAGAGISAGIIGVAVGFGAQSLIKDVIAGLFLVIENQIRVNDVAVINGISGAVEEINLRTTVLRGENGAVHIIPNGGIQTLSNLTREYSFYVFEISLNHDQDAGRAMLIMQEVAAEVRAAPEYRELILADLEVSGIDRFSPSGVVIKARIKTPPAKQWVVGREMNRRFCERFLAERIDLTGAPTAIRLEGREELKAAIREVLAETGRDNKA
jgi:moderate conductance mechanosensitive channel